MSTYYGTSINTNGLTLLLDAANPRSYPGSGTVWTDLAQGLVFNSSGTTNTWGTVGGATALTFNGSGYWECSSGFARVPLGGDCTIILMLYEVGHTTRRTVFEKAGTSYQSYQQEVAMTWEVGQDITYYSRYSADYDFGSTAACDTNKWNMLAIKMSTGLTATARTGFNSKNGSAWSANYTSRSSVALVESGAIRVGTGYAGTVDNGSISMVACYNRMLTDAEIYQNYLAWRTRHGI